MAFGKFYPNYLNHIFSVGSHYHGENDWCRVFPLQCSLFLLFSLYFFKLSRQATNLLKMIQEEVKVNFDSAEDLLPVSQQVDMF